MKRHRRFKHASWRHSLVFGEFNLLLDESISSLITHNHNLFHSKSFDYLSNIYCHCFIWVLTETLFFKCLKSQLGTAVAIRSTLSCHKPRSLSTYDWFYVTCLCDCWRNSALSLDKDETRRANSNTRFSV